MIGLTFAFIGCTILSGAILWPTVLRGLFYPEETSYLQPISDFAFQCRQIRGPGLEACEDAWLSEKTRQLFLACSDSMSRKYWMPNIHRFNVSGRGMDDKIIALDIDKPAGNGFEYRVIPTTGYSGINGDGKLSLVGLTGIDRDDHVELYLVNNRPSVDETTGEYLDHEKVGANSTIEHFRVNLDKEEVQHVKTWAHAQIATPNNIAAVGDGSFYFTNDHGTNKAGIRHHSSGLMKDADVSYCNKDGCRKVAGGYAFPNGLAFGADGLLYVPSAASGNVVVYKVLPDNELEQVDFIKIDPPMDNMALDANGDLYVAALPRIQQSLLTFDDPFGPSPPATVLRIRKTGEGYEVKKVVEDMEGEVLPGATTAVHDAKTGRIFVTGVVSPFITVCEPKAIPPPPTPESGQDSGHQEL